MTDFVQPFQIEKSHVRGRMVRLGAELDALLSKHAYPDTVARFLAETVALTALLASMLKYEGVFTLQTKGEGPVRLMVADVTSDGHLRAFARVDPSADAAARARIECLAMQAVVDVEHALGHRTKDVSL